MKSVTWLCALLLNLAAFGAIEDTKEFQEIHGNGAYTVSQHADAEKRISRLEAELRDQVAFAVRINLATDAMMNIAEVNLRRKGFKKEADRIRREWPEHDGEIVRIVEKKGRDIGDFQPWSIWIAAVEAMIELKLGYQLAFTLRLTDLKDIAYDPAIVFSPCKYGLGEFEKHLYSDPKYRGLLPVVAYWTTNITCSIATFGAGVFFVCSPLSMLVELGVDKVLAPKLAPKIYQWACP